MKNYMWLLTTFVLLTGLILAGCSSDGQDASNVDGSPEPVPPIAVVKAREAVAAVFDMRASSIGIESFVNRFLNVMFRLILPVTVI